MSRGLRASCTKKRRSLTLTLHFFTVWHDSYYHSFACLSLLCPLRYGACRRPGIRVLRCAELFRGAIAVSTDNISDRDLKPRSLQMHSPAAENMYMKRDNVHVPRSRLKFTDTTIALFAAVYYFVSVCVYVYIHINADVHRCGKHRR